MDSGSNSDLKKLNTDSDLDFTPDFSLLSPGVSYGQLDLNPDSDSNTLDLDSDLDSRNRDGFGSSWFRIQGS